MSGDIRLSALVTVHNEEAQLAECLERLTFADEIVVLLDKCTDGSRDIARRFTDRLEEGSWDREGARRNTYTEKMKRKIDSFIGKFFYGQRLGTVEPVFANICSTTGLDQFTLRGKPKVNAQWVLYNMVHNLKKIHRFAPEYA